MAYRISEAAREIGVTSATVRNYLREFSPYFSEESKHQTRKRFSSQDVATLIEITRLSREGYTWSEIPDRLPSPGEIAEELPPPPQYQANEQENALDVLRDQNEQIKILMDITIKSKDETIDVLKQENDRLRGELERLSKPWWRRII